MASVEKLCINLRESLWEMCGKVLHKLGKSEFLEKRWAKVGVLHVGVGKFCRVIYTWINRGGSEFYTVSTTLTITTIKYYKERSVCA